MISLFTLESKPNMRQCNTTSMIHVMGIDLYWTISITAVFIFDVFCAGSNQKLLCMGSHGQF